MEEFDIIEAIKNAKLRSVKASNAFVETRERLTQENIRVFKETFTGESEHPEFAEAMNMAQLYYTMKDKYYAKTSIKMPSGFNNRAKALWTRVVAACAASGASPEDFMKAQFLFFHKAFGRPPDPLQLTTENAVQRASSGEHTTITKNVVGNAIQQEKDFPSIMRNAEQQMRTLMSAHSCTRKEVYEKFVLTGLYLFPKEYLAADPVWRSLT